MTTGDVVGDASQSLTPRHLTLILGIIALAALILLLMGHPPICTCGYV
jgi:hypothetical protein